MTKNDQLTANYKSVAAPQPEQGHPHLLTDAEWEEMLSDLELAGVAGGPSKHFCFDIVEQARLREELHAATRARAEAAEAALAEAEALAAEWRRQADNMRSTEIEGYDWHAAGLDQAAHDLKQALAKAKAGER